MAQFYTLEEAARVLGMSPEDLQGKAQHREIRAFMDSGSWRFRVADIDELARRRGLGSDPDFSLSDPELSLSNLDLETNDGGGELDLSEFQLGTAKPSLGQPTMDLPSFRDDSDRDVLLDDLSVPPSMGSSTNSSSTILGMGSGGKGGKLPSDSDIRVVPEGLSSSDSDVRLSPFDGSSKSASDSDVTLVNDEGSMPDFPLPNPGDTAVRKSPMVGSSAEVPAPPGDSDFEISPSSMIDALQPESGSDFELSALDASDEFDAAPLVGPGDSDVTAAAPADSGINLGRPSDSGINLGGFDMGTADSIELAPLDDSGPQNVVKPKPKPNAAAAPAKAKPALAATPPPVARKGEKDIFEDTDFEVDALDSGEGDDRTMQLEAAGSDFDLDESESASEVFAIDEDDVDENASTAMGPAMLDDESGEFGADDDDDSLGGGGSGWDVDAETSSPVSSGGSQGTVIPTSRDNAEWGGLWVGFLGVGTVLALILAFVGVDLVRNLYDFREGGPASGIIAALAGLMPK